MADVAFGYVYDFGPREEWWARRDEGAWLERRNSSTRRCRAASRDGRLEVLGIESRIRAGSRLDRRPGRRPPTGCARSARSRSSLCQVAGRPVRRDGVAAQLPRRRRRRGAADRPRGRRRTSASRGFRAPLGAPLDATPARAGGRRPHRRDARRARGDRRVIDWIVAERIARYVAGTGNAKLPQVDLRVACRGVRAPGRRLHGPRAVAATAPARGDRAGASGSRANIWLDAHAARPRARARRHRHSVRCARRSRSGSDSRSAPRSASSSATSASTCSGSTSSCCSTRRATTTAAAAVRAPEPRRRRRRVRRRRSVSS